MPNTGIGEDALRVMAAHYLEHMPLFGDQLGS